MGTECQKRWRDLAEKGEKSRPLSGERNSRRRQTPIVEVIPGPISYDSPTVFPCPGGFRRKNVFGHSIAVPTFRVRGSECIAAARRGGGAGPVNTHGSPQALAPHKNRKAKVWTGKSCSQS